MICFFLIPAFARCADQNLAASGAGMMNMPVVPAPGLKGYVCQKQSGFGRIEKWVQIRITNKVFSESGVRLADTEDV